MTTDREPVLVPARDVKVGDLYLPEGPPSVVPDGLQLETTRIDAARSGNAIWYHAGEHVVLMPKDQRVWVLRERPPRTMEVEVPDGHIAIVLPRTLAERVVDAWLEQSYRTSQALTTQIADACRKALAAEVQ